MISSAVLLLLVTSCASVAPTESLRARAGSVDIGDGVSLTFPVRPSYPAMARFSQLITTEHDGRSVRVQSDLELGPERVTAVFSLLGGPPVLTIYWTAGVMDVTSDNSVPVGLDGRRILADIVLANWPASIVQKHLSRGARLVMKPGRRIVSSGARTIIEIDISDTGDRKIFRLHNHAQGYALIVMSKLGTPR